MVYDYLADGDYILYIRSTDAAGNTGSVLILNWIVDTVGPKTTIIGGPSKVINTRSVTFDFSSEEGATYECRLNDAADSTSCGSSVTYNDRQNLALHHRPASRHHRSGHVRRRGRGRELCKLRRDGNGAARPKTVARIGRRG